MKDLWTPWRMEYILDKTGKTAGCLFEAAGPGLAEHLHFHVAPRWQGDHNFMTPLAEVRTIPEHLDRTFDRLFDDFQALPGAGGAEN